MDTLGRIMSTALVMELVVGDLAEMEANSRQEVANGNFKLLDNLHHFSSGCKALYTEFIYVLGDELRQACGGAGFLLSSGITDWWSDTAPAPTFEGVNVVMTQ